MSYEYQLRSSAIPPILLAVFTVRDKGTACCFCFRCTAVGGGEGGLRYMQLEPKFAGHKRATEVILLQALTSLVPGTAVLVRSTYCSGDYVFFLKK